MYSLRTTDKVVLLTAVCSLFIFGAATAYAALTLTATTISSDGAINLNPMGQPVTVNGDLVVTGACTGCSSAFQSALSGQLIKISVGAGPYSIAITPDGATAYVANYSDDTVTPITVATNTAGAPISVGGASAAIAITPDGATAYVANYSSDTVTPITVATNTAGAPISVGDGPWSIAITPDGATVYVANYRENTVSQLIRILYVGLE